MSTFVGTALGAGARVGRYFNVVSLVPSLVFVAYVTALLRAGAWSGPFEMGVLVDALRATDAGDLAALATASLALGIVMHPFQFAMIQALEGYWGPSRLADRLAEHRTRGHRDTLLDLLDRKESQDAALVRMALAGQDQAGMDRLTADPVRLANLLNTFQDSPDGDVSLGAIVRQESAARAIDAYPRPRRVRPTRLGNALRVYEDTAGGPYGLRVIPIAPHLSLTADPEHVAYQSDARQELDLAVRVCVLAAVATALTAVLLSDDRAWVLLALGPYAVAYLAYRGAVSAAHGYGTALRTVLDLNRFALYERLHLPLPSGQEAERRQNAVLLESLAGVHTGLRYLHGPADEHPPATATSPPTPPFPVTTQAGPGPPTT